MTGPGFQVVTADLRTHAGDASQVATMLGQAHTSGQQAALGDQAFGQIAVALLFSQLIKSAAGPAVNLLAQAQATMTAINKTVATAASNYDNVEHTNTSRFLPSTATATTASPSGPASWSTPASPAKSTGGNIMNDVTSLEKDIASGNWVQAGLAGLNVVNDATKVLSDPMGAILQYGLGFLMQAVKPLQQAVGWLVGNPSQVSAYGGAWQGVSQSVGQAGGMFASSVTTNTASWTGQAAATYTSYAANQSSALTALTSATRTIGSMTQSVGTVVGNAQNLIKQLVSRAMSQIVQTALGASFTITIPVIVAKVVNEVVGWMKKIADVINQLTGTLRQLQPLVGSLTQLIGAVQQVVSSGSRPLNTIGSQPVQGITLPSVAPILPAIATR